MISSLLVEMFSLSCHVDDSSLHTHACQSRPKQDWRLNAQLELCLPFHGGRNFRFVLYRKIDERTNDMPWRKPVVGGVPTKQAVIRLTYRRCYPGWTKILGPVVRLVMTQVSTIATAVAYLQTDAQKWAMRRAGCVLRFKLRHSNSRAYVLPQSAKRTSSASCRHVSRPQR